MSRSALQVRQAIEGRRTVAWNQRAYLHEVLVYERRLAAVLGRPVEDLEMLEVGPGQGCDRALYFALRNHVTTVDLDVLAFGLDPRLYWRMARQNGAGRAAKSFGRQVLVGRRSRTSWAGILGVDRLPALRVLKGDVCESPVGDECYDAVVSWSVLEHLDDPHAAVQNVIAALRPGGAFYLSVHLWTANDGHHDLRTFLRRPEAPPPWAHLRADTRSLVQPSAFLNEWRLRDWRGLFDELAPGYVEHLDCFEHPERFGPLLDGPLREQLSCYADEELLTVNAAFGWRKPAS